MKSRRRQSMPIGEIHLDKNSSDHLYHQLSRQLRDQIAEGVLRSNEKLPPIRTLAEKLQINTVTVVNAYRCLEEEGLIHKQVGSGSFVAPRKSLAGNATVIQEDTEHRQLTVGEAAYNFASGTPTTDLFPVARFKDVLNEVLDRDMGDAFGYHDPQGYYPLRTAISELIGAQGMNVDADGIQIISGAQQGIDIVSKAMLKYGDTVLVEAPTYAGALATFRSRGVRVESFPITSKGPDLVKVEALLRKHRPRLIYVMPNFHNPTGWTYPEASKIAFLKLCSTYDTMILEDDYASELNFTTQTILPLKALDAENRVIYIKSFSKIMMPGLRLGLMTIPPRLAEPILSAKQSTDVSTFGLTQRAFELFIRKGYWKQQVESVRQVFKERYIAFIKASDELLIPPLTLEIPAGGIHFWFQVPVSAAEALYVESARRGVLVVPGDHFYMQPGPEKYLRLSTASMDPDDIVRGLELFSDAVSVVLGRRGAITKRSTYTPIL